jgi:hypothetical protein
MPRLLVLAALLFAIPAHADVTIDWVIVGGPGNACVSSPDGCFGSTAQRFRIGKYEITNAQYAEFLNAVAADDTNALYDVKMELWIGTYYGGITRSGSPGNYAYATIADRENMPVNWVTFWDALRFANWLHNGQPTGAQDNTTTEDGAYTLTPAGIANNSIIRNPGARVVIPTDDEWFKAGHYDVGLQVYYGYPTGSHTVPACEAPGATANTANCGYSIGSVGDLTGVGSYTGSPSPNGTFDQGGNVWEWTETTLDESLRGLRGGSFNDVYFNMQFFGDLGANPVFGGDGAGFRVARPGPFPEGIPALSPLGLLVVAAGLLGFGVYHRGRK